MGIRDKIKKENNNTCSLCQKQYAPKVLDFHHIDSATKKASVGQLRYEDDIRNEAAKCILLCSNCHREFHSGLHIDKNLHNFKRSWATY